MIIRKVLLLASDRLACTIHIDKITAKFEAQLLLQHALKANHAWLIAHDNDILSANSYAQFEQLLNRRLNGEPIAYILGHREFFGLQLKVSADTLIPRPDTETLVEAALAKIPHMVRQAHHERDLQVLQDKGLLGLVRPELVEGCANENIRILDLGTGSGAIALAIAKYRPNALITAIDASESALTVAQENAQSLKITNVNFVRSNWFSALSQPNLMQRFDVIVSNPPYIEADDMHLKQGDLRFEPLSALASGADGLDDIRHIIPNAPLYLNKSGWLMLEHGYNQAQYVAELLGKNGFTQISHVKDFAGILRVTIGRYVDD